MLPTSQAESARAQASYELADKEPHDDKAPPPSQRNNRDKIRCLDGLRGIACLLVFNYHFLWPWTPSIMLGYGAFPPGAPEPYWGLHQLPIICLLTRGRPMVAIFFAISGYVLCRHILRAIHERRLDAAYRSLSSSVFRRVFRLYIPPTVSMFLVAMLAQLGAFRPEDDIFMGRDSVYINGTVTKLSLGTPCVNSTAVAGASGVAEYLGLQTSGYLYNTTGWDESLTLCVNATSKEFGPSRTYSLLALAEDEFRNLNGTDSDPGAKAVETYMQHYGDEYWPPYQGPVPLHTGNGTNMTLCDGTKVRNTTDFMLVQMGGSWEEHPFIHDNITYAVQNFTRAYAEWANPFNFGHYHPRYDPHTFTIPMELRGSMFIYIFLLGTAALKAKYRLGIAGGLMAYSLHMSRWDMATFLGGTALSELDIRRSDESRTLAPPATGAQRQKSASRDTALRYLGIVTALHFLSYPDAAAEYTPGFRTMAKWVPRYYIPLSGWMVYQSLGALILLPCVMRTPFLVSILESRFAQYLGRISFSLYLVHGPILHSVGFWIMPRLFDYFGQPVGFVVGWTVLMTLTLYLANIWYKKVDLWSVTVGKRIERMVVH